MMDIEEERKAFEGYVLSLRKYEKRSPKFIFDLDENGDYDNQDIYELHHAWQASANREGFILKEIKDCVEVNFDPEREDDQHSYWSGYNQAFRELKSIIETQEQSNV